MDNIKKAAIAPFVLSLLMHHYIVYSANLVLILCHRNCSFDMCQLKRISRWCRVCTSNYELASGLTVNHKFTYTTNKEHIIFILSVRLE